MWGLQASSSDESWQSGGIAGAALNTAGNSHGSSVFSKTIQTVESIVRAAGQ